MAENALCLRCACDHCSQLDPEISHGLSLFTSHCMYCHTRNISLSVAT